MNKRMTCEQINQLVNDLLKRRNHSEMNKSSLNAKPNAIIKSKTCSLVELAQKGSLVNIESTPNVISLSSSVGDFSIKAENAFKSFNNYLSQLKSKSFVQQLSKLQFPLFVNIFIDLCECGQKGSARRFIREHKSKFNEISELRTIEFMNNSLSAHSIDPNLKNFKSSKYCVDLSDDCFKQFIFYFNEINDLVIVQMLNTFFNINLYSSDNQIESEKPEELNSSSQLLTYNESEISQNSKIFESNSDKELLLSAIKKVRNSEPCVPSICLYSIQSSSLSCISVTNDMKLVAGGFEDSKICLWSFASNDYNKCHSIMNVKRKSSQIELNIIDHDLKDDENSDQVSDNELDLNSSTTGQSVKVLRGHSGPVYGLTFVPETNILLSCSCDTTVRAWDTVSSNNIAVYESHLSPIWSIDSCILGNYFATGCKDGVAYLWSIERSFPLRLYCGHNMDVDCVKFHPNCTFIATGSGDKLIKMWDIQQARVVRSFNGHQASIYSLSFSPSGKYLASAGEDRKVKLWDIASGKLIKDFNGHTDTVHSLSFNYNETILASCGSDQTLKLWNLQNITDSSNPTLIFKSEISENTSSKNSTNGGLLVSNQLELNNVIHTEFMPHNLLLTVGTKMP